MRNDNNLNKWGYGKLHDADGNEIVNYMQVKETIGNWKAITGSTIWEMNTALDVPNRSPGCYEFMSDADAESNAALESSREILMDEYGVALLPSELCLRFQLNLENESDNRVWELISRLRAGRRFYSSLLDEANDIPRDEFIRDFRVYMRDFPPYRSDDVWTIDWKRWEAFQARKRLEARRAERIAKGVSLFN